MPGNRRQVCFWYLIRRRRPLREIKFPVFLPGNSTWCTGSDLYMWFMPRWLPAWKQKVSFRDLPWFAWIWFEHFNPLNLRVRMSGYLPHPGWRVSMGRKARVPRVRGSRERATLQVNAVLHDRWLGPKSRQDDEDMVSWNIVWAMKDLVV